MGCWAEYEEDCKGSTQHTRNQSCFNIKHFLSAAVNIAEDPSSSLKKNEGSGDISKEPDNHGTHSCHIY